MLPLIIGAGLTAGGIGAGMLGANKVDEARRAVQAAERARQAAFDAEAAQYNTQSQNRYQGFGDQQTARARQLGEMFRGPTASTSVPMPMLPQSTSDIVNREIAAKTGDAKTFTDNRATALGNVRSFGDLLGGISRDQAHDASLIGQIGGFKKGAADAASYESESANHAGDQMKFIGDILKGLGSVGISAGLSGGMFPGVGATTAASPAVMNGAKAAYATDPYSIANAYRIY